MRYEGPFILLLGAPARQAQGRRVSGNHVLAHDRRTGPIRPPTTAQHHPEAPPPATLLPTTYLRPVPEKASSHSTSLYLVAKSNNKN